MFKTTRLNFVARSVATAVFAAAIAMPAAAQNTQSVNRWQAWLGCWVPTNTLIRVIGRTATTVVCVVPTSVASAVDVVTVSGGKILDRTHVDTDGQPHTIAKDGCTGWQSAKWSPDSHRVYLKSEFNCSGAPLTHLSAMYAMAGAGEWIDVQGMRVDQRTGVHTVRYRQAGEVSLPREIAQKLPAHAIAKAAATLLVSEPPSIAQVEEASHEVDGNIVATWLIEADKLSVERPVPLTGKQLVRLADHGVPANVIDVMVGLSYPDELAVNPATASVARQNTDSAYIPSGELAMLPPQEMLIGFDRFGFPLYVTEAAVLNGCSSPFLYGPGPYDVGWNLYASHYLCSGFGYGGAYVGFPGYNYGGFGNYGYGAGFFGGGPSVVPRGAGTGTTTTSHGRVVNGKGYSQGTSNGSTSTGSGASTTSAPSSPPPPPPRTAEPKKP
jgi:hypothetical protein